MVSSRVTKAQPTHIEAQAEMVSYFANELDLPPYFLVGHDLGGGIGQLLALNYPHSISKNGMD